MKEKKIERKVMNKDQFVDALYRVYTEAGLRVLFSTYCNNIKTSRSHEMSDNIEDVVALDVFSISGELSDGTLVYFSKGFEGDSYGREYHMSIIVDDIEIIGAEDTTPINEKTDWYYSQILDENGHCFYGRHPLENDVA